MKRNRSTTSITLVVVLGLACTGCEIAYAPDHAYTWLALGDSFSSGEGMPDAFDQPGVHRCQRSPSAYPRAAAMLVQSAPPIGVQFLACTGAIVSGEIAGVTADTRDKTSDAQLAELRPGEVFDVISLTFGGNNLGFRDIITGCLTNLGGDYLNSYLLDGELGLLVINNRPGFCTIDERAMQRKIGELESLLRDLYERLATEHLKPGGRLYVLGYPHLFAPPEDWPGDAKWFTCSGVKQTDAKQIRELTVQLNHATAAAADTANDTAEPRGVRVIWLPVDKLFANHELCGPEPRWINSWPTVDLEFRGTDLLAYMSGSFHPNEKGHAAEAALLVAQVRSDLMIDSQ